MNSYTEITHTHTMNTNTHKHTSGPWIIESSETLIEITDSATEGHCIAHVRLPLPHDDMWGVRCEYQHNARLMAAAPEMLAALEAVIRADVYTHERADALQLARAAIARATGKEAGL